MQNQTKIMNELTTNDSETPNPNQSKSKSETITQWVNASSTLTEDEQDRESVLSDSTGFSSSVVDSDYDIGTLSLSDQFTDFRKLSLTSSTINNVSCPSSKTDVLQQIFNRNSSIQTVGNVHIENSSQVHIGNVTYITGPVHIINPNKDELAQVFSNVKASNSVPASSSTSKQKSNISLEEDEKATADREEAPRDDAFHNKNIKPKLAEHVLHIVERRRWLAQKPMDPYEYLTNPAEFVIISHSDTEMATTMPDNIFLIRNIQCFHIESCQWDDIGYNFLIGNDGNVYEGRGWGVVGAHTYGYNRVSVGITFVGCFMRELPPANSLAACKELIRKGVDKGYIAPDYKLVGHRQCCATESPGRKLYEEIQTWDHFREHFDVPNQTVSS